MKISFPEQLNNAVFLSNYWQRHPLFMPGALRDFGCPVEPEDLAGLACEPDIESRIVIEKGGSAPWEVRHGPFEETAFARLPADYWTLLVQDVDKHLPEVADLLDAFRFLPDWRLDDIMISYAADRGSVGPHIDQYDVFLLQANGRRRWRIHTRPVADDAFIPGLELRILPEFESEQEWLLEPGDMLYLPPGVAHWGIAEGPGCMTCSVGFRAPAYQEMADDWCTDMIRRQAPPGLYTDGELSVQPNHGEITRDCLDHVGEILDRVLEQDDESRSRWFGRFITEPKPHLDVGQRLEQLSEPGFMSIWRSQQLLRRNSWSRFAYIRGSRKQDYLYVNGAEYPLGSELGRFLALLSNHRQWQQDSLRQWLNHAACRQLLTRLYNQGHVGFDDD